MARFFVFLILLTGPVIQSQTKKLQAETNHSSVVFEVPVAGFTLVNGRFNEFDIILDYHQSDPDSIRLATTIQVESIDTGIDDRDAHLRSDDFFDVATYPTIEFKSDSVAVEAENKYLVYGKLSMHGVTRNTVVPMELVKADGNTLGFRIRSSLNRLDYGVGKDFVHSSMPDFLPDTILVRIDFWTKRRKE